LNPSDFLAMEAQQVLPPDGSPLLLRGSWDAGLRRLLWLVKRLRTIPHYIALAGIEQAAVGGSFPLFIEVLR
jgi:hypothetical protein